MPEDELAQLFPELAPILKGFSTPPANSTLQAAEGGGVTDESVQAWVQERMGHRAPLSPLSTSGGGTTPQTPGLQFRSGVSSPPPVGGVEDGGTGTTAPVPPTPPAAELDDEDDDDGEEAPLDDDSQLPTDGEEAPAEPPEDVVVIGDKRIPRQRVLQYEAFQDFLNKDPELTAIIAARLQGQPLPTSPPAQPFPPTAPTAPVPPQPFNPQPSPSLQAPEGLDLDDPAISALWSTVQAQNAQLQAQSAAVQALYDQQITRAQEDNESLVNRAVTSFQQQHSLTEEEVGRIRRTAGQLGVVNSLLNGIDPVTGAPVVPDPLTAIDRAMEIAMYSIPEFRQKAYAAQVHDARARAKKKSKLAGVGGSSGSVPRTPTAPQAQPGDWRTAAVADLTRMMAQ